MDEFALPCLRWPGPAGADPPSPCLVARGLSVAYARRGQVTPVFDRLDLTVGEREFVVLVGASGAGKSTLLRVLAGLIRPQAGTVSFPRAPAGGLRRNMVFQEHGLFPWMRVIDNVAFGLRLRGIGKAARRARALVELEKVGLVHSAYAYPGELSGGMQQRASLARAFANDPDLLLMDEPFAALDAQTRWAMQQQLVELWEVQRRTVFFVTHSIEEALLIADRILVLGAHPAGIEAEVTVPFARPRDLFALRFDRDFGALSHDLWNRLRSDAAGPGGRENR